jgi:pSer/pThr/pTyr-binding forkhead associated (FHA) protein
MQPTLFIARDDRVVALHDGVTRIGRSITADVELDDITVSRRHALIVRGEGKAVLLDDGSRNGVYLNGIRVAREELSDGDTIRLGKTDLRYAAAVRELIPA